VSGPLPEPADRVVADYLSLADARAPGLIDGLYLEGSLALDDFRPHTSDVDFVAVTANPLTRSEETLLTRLHTDLAATRKRPHFDGVYVTPDALKSPPSDHPRLSAHEGKVSKTPPTPITWHTLAWYGVTCRGPSASTLDIATDADALASWTASNLESYWRPWLKRASRVGSAWRQFALTPFAAAWVVTGLPRLHYTLATGDITSKTGAAEYALRTFPERWHRVIREALRIRDGEAGRSLYRMPYGRRRDALAFGEMVLRDAVEVYGAGQ
jgi:Domain of unknown function (DUF4111)